MTQFQLQSLKSEKGGEISVENFFAALLGVAVAALSIWAVYFAVCVTISVAQWASVWPF
jgi:hypothetical protein